MMELIVKRQQVALKNIDLLEMLRVRKLYFPERYKASVIELAKKYGKFLTIFEPYSKNKVYLSYSGNCGTIFNEKTFKTKFEAIEYSLIASLNGRETKITYSCFDKKCDICSSFLVA